MMYLTLYDRCTGVENEGCGGDECEACNGDRAIPRNVTLQEFAAMLDVIRTGEIAVKEEATR